MATKDILSNLAYLQIVFSSGGEGADVAHEGLDVLVLEEVVPEPLAVSVLLAALGAGVGLLPGVGALVAGQRAAGVGAGEGQPGN